MDSTGNSDVEKGLPQSAPLPSEGEGQVNSPASNGETYPGDISEGIASEDLTSQQEDVEKDTIDIGRVPTHASHATVRSRLGKVTSSVVHRPKKDHLPRDPLPETNLAAGVVGWDSQDDPAMPLNFSKFRKWLIVSFLSLITFITPFSSSILSPGITTISAEFGHSDDLTYGSMPVSIFLLGYAVGPLFLSPLSEIYGRHPVLTASNAFFSVWQIGCALAPSLESLIAFRFLAGIGGSACMTLGGGIIADLFPVDERGAALAGWTLGPLVGPCIGPLAGAFIADSIGWRWDFWISLISAVIITAVIAIFSTETNHRVLIERKVRRLARETGRDDLRSCYEDPAKPRQSMKQKLLGGLSTPFKMLLFSPLIFSLSLYIAFAYGVLYLLFNTVPMVFQGRYGWTISQTGLVYLPLGAGFLVGLAVFAAISDKTVVRMTRANGGRFEPEMRLPACLFFACFLPITFFVYGWCAHHRTHVAVPLVGLVPYGFGLVGIWQPIQAYIIDSYPVFAASGMAAFTVLRSLVGAFLPLAGPEMYEALGLGWGNTLLGLICVGMIPVPALIYKFGGRLRKRWALNL